MALIIDAGNSRVKICSWETADRVDGLLSGMTGLEGVTLPPLDDLFSFERPHDDKTNEEFRQALLAFLSGIPAEQITEIALVSTVPPVTSLITEVFPHVTVVDHSVPFPFQNTLANIEEVGPDRFCNIATAINSGLASALVVDAGTATTFDLLLDGVFCGGLIAPGMAFAALKLGEAASRLSPVPFAPCPLKVGVNTTSAMAAGGFHVGIQGVQGVIQGLMDEYGDIPVVLTGGGGRYLSHQGALHDPHWTQRGAAVLAGYSGLYL